MTKIKHDYYENRLKCTYCGIFISTFYLHKSQFNKTNIIIVDCIMYGSIRSTTKKVYSNKNQLIFINT